MNSSLDIVELIENNPITRLSNTYQNKLITKIKNNFTNTEQQLFVSSFYCFLNYNQRNDFVIDLDNVWKWIGFSSKFNSKRMLDKHFNIDIDYKYLPLNLDEQVSHTHGGHNKEIIMLTIRTFKLFCLKAGTKKAEQIHEYYIKLEETLQEIVQEESDELKLQLENKDKELEKKDNEIENKDKELEKKDNEIENKDKELEKKDNEKNRIREKTLIDNFQNNHQCVYYGVIDNVSNDNEKLIKFGNSNDLKTRVYSHKKTYLNFRLTNAFRVENKLQIENAIKDHPILSKRQRTLTINGKNYVELLNIDGLTFTELDKIIKALIASIDFTPENYEKLLNENKTLKQKLVEKSGDILLKVENEKLKLENMKLIKKYNSLLRKTKNNIDNNVMEDDEKPQNKGEDDYEQSINKIKSCFKNITKNKDGNYHIQDKIYDKLTGTRYEVYQEIAFKTTGELTKDDLIINKNGKIVSKRKCIQETLANRFEEVNLAKKKKNII
jgi:hypothetical protein